MSTGFTPFPNKASAFLDAMSAASQSPRRQHAERVRRPSQLLRLRTAWAGTALALVVCLAGGFWLSA